MVLLTEKKVLFLLILVFIISAFAKKSRKSRSKVDVFTRTRCDLQCSNLDPENKAECRIQCRLNDTKPGQCPTSDSPQWAAACVHSCTKDRHCEGTKKCCQLGCGSACTEPIDLLTLPGLPAIPVLSQVVEKRRSTIVKWSSGVGDTARSVPGPVMYLLQEQHMLGPKYEESRLGEWGLMLRTNKSKASLRNRLKPGHWYRFRVAAVNAAGTRGYGEPSAPFTPRKGPRPPPPPRHVHIKPLRTENGTITARVEWREPHSELPILRYKVFWSRRVRGLTGELDSVLVSHKTVPKDQTNCEINGLQPNSMYFIQVQTISQFGVAKLRSDKAALVYNTTNPDDYMSPEELHKRDQRYVKSLRLQNIIWDNVDNNIKARITWAPVTRHGDPPKRYLVQWRSLECPNNKNQSTKELAAITELTSFEIYELKYNCKYRVNVNRPNVRFKASPDSFIVVTVPGCDYFKRMVKASDIICTN